MGLDEPQNPMLPLSHKSLAQKSGGSRRLVQEQIPRAMGVSAQTGTSLAVQGMGNGRIGSQAERKIERVCLTFGDRYVILYENERDEYEKANTFRLGSRSATGGSE